MTCRELTEFLDDYIANALPASRRRIFETHLAGCPDCVNYLTSYRRAIDLSALAFEPAESLPNVPPNLVQAVLKALRVEREV